jgi:outer membrane protein assembly factor BamA
MVSSRGRLERNLRRGLIAVLALAALALASLLGVWLALQSPGLRRAVLGRVSNWTERRVGLRFEAADFELRLLAGVLEVRELSLGVGAENPFLSAESLRVAWRPRSLVGGSPRLEALEVDSPRIDLRKPLPDFPSPTGKKAQKPIEIALAVDHFRVLEGFVTGPVPAAAADRISSWEMGGIALEGRLEGSQFRGRFGATQTKIELARQEVVGFTLAGEAEGEVGGAVRFDSVSLAGDPLTARLSAVYGTGRRELEARFRIEADPGFWLAGESSPIATLEGEVDLAAWTGTARLVASDQPAELLSGWIDSELGEALALSSSQIDLEAQIELTPEESATVRISSSFRCQEDLLTRLSARSLLSWREPFQLDVPVELELLPGQGGTHRVTGRILGEDVRRPEEWRVVDGLIDLEVPAADSLVRDLSRLWPQLVPEARVAAFPGLGELSGEARFSGPLGNPDLEARLEWRPHSPAVVRVRASGQPLRRQLRIESEAQGLEIGHFLPTARGRLGWTGRVEGEWRRPRGQLTVEATGLVLGDEIGLDAVRADLESDGVRLDWKMAAESSSHGRFEGVGKIALEQPVRRAAGELTWVSEGGMVGPVKASLEMNEGVLELAVRDPVRILESSVSARLHLPLAALATVPQLAFLRTTPLARASGPVVLDWEIAEGDWTGTLPLGWKARLASLRAGSRAHLEIDLEHPSRSAGSAEIYGLALAAQGREAFAEGPVRVELRDGIARVAGLRIVGDGLALEMEAEARLSDSWRLGSAVGTLLEDLQSVANGSIGETWLSDLPVENVSPGLLQFAATLEGRLTELAGELRIEAPDLRVRHPALPALEFSSPGMAVAMAGGEVRIEEASLRIGDGMLRARGRFRANDPLADASGELELLGALPVLESIELPLEIRQGRLVVDSARLQVSGGEGFLRLGMALDGSSAPATLEWETPAADWAPLIGLLLAREEPESLFFSSRGRVALDPRDPTASTASVVVEDGRIALGNRATTLETPLALEVENRVARILPLRLTASGKSFDLRARAELEPQWRQGQPAAGAVRQLEASGTGILEAGLLNPFLLGGRAEGPLNLTFDVRGPFSDLEGRIGIKGPEASIVFLAPYLTRISEPVLEFTVSGGRLELSEAEAKLNEGRASISGVVADQGRGELQIRFAESLFRLDYGLLATLDGRLGYRWEPDGSSTLSGTLIVDRAALTRPIRLDLDLLSQLLLPIDLTTTEEDPRQRIALELELETREGVRIKNNLGDLLVRWEPISVTGSLARPVLEGTLEVEPGGLLYAYGQTVRLERASIEYPGAAGADPRLSLEATTSLEDPTIGRLAGSDFFRGEAAGALDQPEKSETIAEGLVRFYGEQFVGRLSESVGAVSLSLRPVLIFGEADPAARLTVSRDFSPNFSVAASVDLREAEGQTYVLEAHELRGLPGLVGQAFTDDESEYGGVALQRLGFGGSRRSFDAGLPRLRKIRIAGRPAGASKRGIKRALGVKRGDLFSPPDRFAAEVAVLEYLRGRGYSGARVDLVSSPAGRKVVLDLSIEAGPRALVEFTGEKIPKPLRRAIRSLYRAELFQVQSIEEMRRETVKALRSRGFLDPVVTIEVTPIDVEDPGGNRRVLVQTEGGARIRPGPPVFLGVSESDSEYLGRLFAGPVQRVELAVGAPEADRRLLDGLRSLGFVDPRIVNRYVSLESKELTVEIDPGARRSVAELTVSGVEETEAERMRQLILIQVGDPLREDRLSMAALRLERDLESRGYPEARVQALIDEPPGDDSLEGSVRFEVEPGPLTRIEEVEFTGARSTRSKYARRVTGLEPDTLLEREALSRARSDLWRTGLFSAVSARTDDLGEGLSRVTFDLAERDRYEVAYGIRWESDDDSTAVVELTDRNFLGRNLTLGLRALYSDDDKSLRWMARVPRLFGTHGSLELFALARELLERGIIAEILEGTLQYSLPIGKRHTLRPYARYETTRLTEEEPDLFLPLDLTIRSPLLGLQYLYDSRRGELLAESGIFASIDLSGSEDFLDSDFRYARLFGQVHLYRPLGRSRPLVWAQSLRLGFAEAFGQELICTEQSCPLFQAGGEYSLRGYATDSLGSAEQLGSAAELEPRGKVLLVVNEELRWRMLDDYTFLAFLDVGNVWEDPSDFGSDLVKSVGIGLRAVTPIGLLRLDLAHALDRRPGVDPEFKLYFGLGSTF